MNHTLSNVWKIAGTSLAIIPGIYAVVFYMVQAVSIDIEHRLEHLEKEMAKGGRFTISDGARLYGEMEAHDKHHTHNEDKLRTLLDEIRYDDATFKANINSLSVRFMRIEDRVYKSDFELPRKWDFKNAPYKEPIQIYVQPDFIPVGYSFSIERAY